YLLISVAIVVLDQATKYWVSARLQGDADIVVIRGFLNFSYTENQGIAFGMLNNGNMKWLLVTVSMIAIVAVIFYLTRASAANRALIFSLALLAGGICGNLVDRIRMGRVIDFIEVYYGNHQFPVFNAADAAITVGALLLALDLFMTPHHHQTLPVTEPNQPLPGEGSAPQ
ncbi:MAG TPA: signal peptidase II, partial [Blastocatellia bacterium]|nr:signal peptidase II [Blastocatellia bacterium]